MQNYAVFEKISEKLAIEKIILQVESKNNHLSVNYIIEDQNSNNFTFTLADQQ
jgi:hypothetical protein